jgi:gamma-glutamyltranspeptidase/glutathione hydrolase
LVALNATPAAAGNSMVATANRHASEAAIEMLRKGGSAVDAAIAAQLVLSLVEPQSSGIGGGAFLLHWSAKTAKLDTYDGRETAPGAATPELFLNQDGTPMKFMDAVVGGRAVGVPGVVAMLAKAHSDHGRLAWSDLFAPAIALARNGFVVSPRLYGLLARFKKLQTQAATLAYFFRETNNGIEPHPVGYVLKNAAFAQTLEKIASEGAKGFYEGSVAEAIVSAVRSYQSNPGVLTLADLAAYEAKRRDPVCATYRTYKVCGMGPPTSGGLTSLMTLKLAEKFDLPSMKPGALEAVHLISEASRLAFADRGLYMADADFVKVPAEGLLSPGYIAKRAELIDPVKSMGKAEPGTPPGAPERKAAGDDLTRSGTSHFSIVDANGNAVSMTTSVEGGFGSHQLVKGFLLNNQLTDFSFVPEKDDEPVANAVQAGKRPRSSMSPTLIFNADGSLFAAIGSPGGSRIIGFVTKTVIGLIDWKLSMQAAINLPHHVNRNGKTELELNTTVGGLVAQLQAMGHAAKTRSLNSGLHGIRITNEGMDGGADPRREGVVLEAEPD